MTVESWIEEQITGYAWGGFGLALLVVVLTAMFLMSCNHLRLMIRERRNKHVWILWAFAPFALFGAIASAWFLVGFLLWIVS